MSQTSNTRLNPTDQTARLRDMVWVLGRHPVFHVAQVIPAWLKRPDGMPVYSMDASESNTSNR